MMVKKFSYLKEGTTEKKDYEILVLPPKASADAIHENGIALNYLTEEERTTVLEIQKAYEEGLKPFVAKAYRNFLRKGMTLNE